MVTWPDLILSNSSESSCLRRELPDWVDAAVVPPEIVDELDLPVREDDTGALRPQGTLYEARISIRNDDNDLVLGSRGRAKIAVAPMTWGRRLWRALSQTFAFQL